MAITAPYTANGLSSGLDDAAIIQSLVALKQAPITALQTQAAAMQTQVSDLGQIAADLTALQTAMDNLASTGAVAAAVTSTNTAFGAAATPQASAGQYSVQVTALASAAKARSQAFATSGSPITGGTLNLDVQGTAYSVAITDGESLVNVVAAINQSGAPVNATLLSDGVSQYLEITNTAGGFPSGSSAAAALSVSETTTGTQGQALAVSVVQAAANAALTVDGLAITSTSNVISNAIPGVTLNLNSTETAPENLVVATDHQSTGQNLQTVVTAYNTLNTALQAQLNPAPSVGADGSLKAQPAALSNDAAILGLQQELQQLVTSIVPGVNGFNSLASIGLTTSDQDGSLSINAAALDNALNTNPQAVDALFSQASTGVAAAFDHLATSFIDPATGAITQEKHNLSQRASQLGDQQVRMQADLATYQTNLQQQFAAMEQLVAGFKAVGNYLTELAGVQTAKSSG